MLTSQRLEMTLLGGARELLASHRGELPQRDDLCGAFCGALALRAAGVDECDGDPVDQDAVAVAAGSAVTRLADPDSLPRGELGRRDYRLSLPFTDESSTSGTSAAGLVRAIELLAGGRLAAVPYAGPWTASTLGGLFDVAAGLTRPVTLVVNLATHHLWGASAGVPELLTYLLDGALEGPAPDWDVGHFACVIGRVQGPAGNLYGVADTYPSLGRGGLHLQPQERLAAAIERRDMPAGGVIVVTAPDDAPALRSGADALGLVEGIWDNGSVIHGAAAA
jgi:uncharacterized protein DUF6885